MPRVRVPDLGVVNFPDTMSPADIEAAVASLTRGQPMTTPPTVPSAPASAPSRLMRFLTAPLEAAVGSAEAPLPGGLYYEGVPELARGVGETLVRGALPTAGAALGAAGGPATAGTLAAGGEAVNQLLGLSEPSPSALAMQGIAPKAGQVTARGINVAGEFIGRRLPGAAATLHEMAADALKGIQSRLFGRGTSSDDLYAVVNQFNPTIRLEKTIRTAKDLLTKEQVVDAGLKLPTVAETSASIRGRFAPQTIQTGLVDVRGRPLTRVLRAEPEMAFQDIRVNLRRIGDKIRDTRISGGEEHGAWKSLFRAYMDDLEAAATQGDPALPAVQALKAANRMARVEFVADEVADIMSVTKGGVTSRADGMIQVNFGRILNAIQKSDDIRAVLPKEDFRVLVDFVRDLAKRTPGLPPPSGVAAGTLRRFASTATGGALGFLGGGPQAAAVGVLIGAKLPDILGKMVMSDSGRLLLRQIVQEGGGLVSPQTLMLLSAAAATTDPARAGAARLGELGQEFAGQMGR